MRLSLWCICAVILLALTACDDYSHSGNVLEIHCVDGIGFDANKLCVKPDRPGAELAFRVNEKTEKVLITVVKDDGSWGIKDLFLEHCSVVDTTNWKCTDSDSEHGMLHGRYYYSFTGGGPPFLYTSSISGPTFLALHNNRIAMPTAMTKTGYSFEESQRSAWTDYTDYSGQPCMQATRPDCIKKIIRQLPPSDSARSISR
jgi:hypothetical protein